MVACNVTLLLADKFLIRTRIEPLRNLTHSLASSNPRLNSLVVPKRRLGLLDVVEVGLPEVDVQDLHQASLEQLANGREKKVIQEEKTCPVQYDTSQP